MGTPKLCTRRKTKMSIDFFLLTALVLFFIAFTALKLLHLSGAGVLPFYIDQEKKEIFFLFHRIFRGKKKGFVVDWGGSTEPKELPQVTACREFIEETEGMFFAQDVNDSDKSPRTITLQTQQGLNLLHRTQRYCQAEHFLSSPKSLLTYHLFLIETGNRPRLAQQMNERYSREEKAFSKRREVFWLSGAQVIDLLRDERTLPIEDHSPLFVRVKKVSSLIQTIQNIQKLVREGQISPVKTIIRQFRISDQRAVNKLFIEGMQTAGILADEEFMQANPIIVQRTFRYITNGLETDVGNIGLVY